MVSDNRDLLIQLNNAGICRDGRWLVRHINLDLLRGEIITLIGPNGSGKSTTAKLALKIMPPSEGVVWQKPGIRIGYVPQKLHIDRTLPINVMRLMQLTAPLDDKTITDALEEVGMRHLAQAPVATLSGGELQRVLLARAGARKPDVMVLDEPLQGVDFSGETALYELISQYRERLNCAILMISHDLHIVMAASDQVICLNGHICCSGKPEDVASSDEYQALFANRDTNAIALYRHHHDHSHHADGSICNKHNCGGVSHGDKDHV